MAFKEVTTKGTIEWAKIFEENRDLVGYEGAYEACEGAYTVVQVMDKEEYEKLKKAGTQKKPIQKRLMDGELAINFERKHKVVNSEGVEVPKAGGAPKVIGPNGKPWNLEEDGRIGNGTLAEVTNLINTFKGRDGKTYSRTALVKVKILELVPYVREEDNEEAA